MVKSEDILQIYVMSVFFYSLSIENITPSAVLVYDYLLCIHLRQMGIGHI